MKTKFRTSTTEAPARDFWLDLLENVTTTTPRPFWADLLSSTTSTTSTTTTTLRPLIVGDQKLNESSEYFDLSALLSGNQNSARKREEQPINNNHNNANGGFVNTNSNQHGNLNTGPVNLNQWNFDRSPNQQNNNGKGNMNGNFFRGQQNNGRGQLNQPQNFGRGQLNNVWGQNNMQFQQNNNGRGQGNNGRGQGNNGRGQGNNGRGQGNNGRGQGNNNRGRNGIGNQNRGFIFPDSDIRPNTFQEERTPITTVDTLQPENVQNFRPSGPVNVMVDQNPSIAENKKVQELIMNVFDTSENANTNTPIPVSSNNPEKLQEAKIDEFIANIFNVNQNQNSPPVNPNSQVEFFPRPPQQQQMEFINPQTSGHFNAIPVIDQQFTTNSLDTAPSTSFIQQPVVVETFTNNPPQTNEFNPIQVVYENLVNSGMDIVKAKAEHVDHIFNQHQQQFGQIQQVPNTVVVLPQNTFGQSPQFIYQPPLAGQPIGQHTSEQLVEQSESSSKEPRSTSPIQQFVQQPPSGAVFNVQSPPKEILDPFKPFEFRPPPEDENVLFVENNSLLRWLLI